MGPTSSSQVVDLMVACVRFDSDSPDQEELAALLSRLRFLVSEIFDALAITMAASSRWQGIWSADRENPGYLVRSVDGLEIRVPWNLFQDFPPPEVLEEFVSIAKRIRSGEDTTICLSGSSAFYSSVHPVGDIDFCEYVQRAGAANNRFDRTVLKVSALADEALVCTCVKIVSPLEQQRKRPWEPPLPAQDSAFLRQARGAAVGKCEFIGKTSSEGVLEITNFVLFLDDDPETGSGRYSFPAQETPISDTNGWVPRRLSEPLTLGRYIQFLRQQASEKLDTEKPGASLSKASKRSLSLARILFQDDLASRLLDLMREQDIVVTAAIQSRAELQKKIRQMRPDPQVRVFEQPLTDTLRKLVQGLDNSFSPQSGSETDDSWHEKAEHLLASSAGDARARAGIQGVLDSITGLLTRTGYNWQ